MDAKNVLLYRNFFYIYEGHYVHYVLPPPFSPFFFSSSQVKQC